MEICQKSGVSVISSENRDLSNLCSPIYTCTKVGRILFPLRLVKDKQKQAIKEMNLQMSTFFLRKGQEGGIQCTQLQNKAPTWHDSREGDISDPPTKDPN